MMLMENVNCIIFQISRTILLKEYFAQFCVHFVISFVIIIYVFLSNYFGQRVIDHNNHVYITA